MDQIVKLLGLFVVLVVLVVVLLGGVAMIGLGVSGGCWDPNTSDAQCRQAMTTLP